MVSAIFASSFSLISQQDTLPPSARSTTRRHVEPSLTGLSSAINIQHSLSLHKLHSVIGVGYTDEFSHVWVLVFFLNVSLIISLFPRHSGWEFQKHSLLCYLRSHCSPTGLTRLRLISEDSHRLQRQHAGTAAECFEKLTLFFFPCF